MIKTFVKIILVIWQLPQIILGALLLAVVLLFEKYSEAQKKNDDFVIKTTLFSGGISLGYFVFVSSFSENLINHELGHCKQSKYLGWLYLIVIGLPSIIWCGLKQIGLFKNTSYYWLYCEAWADKLGNVDR